MVEALMETPNDQTELKEPDLGEADVTRILTENGYHEMRIGDRTEIPLSMKVAAGAGIVATGAGLILAKSRSRR